MISKIVLGFSIALILVVTISPGFGLYFRRPHNQFVVNYYNYYQVEKTTIDDLICDKSEKFIQLQTSTKHCIEKEVLEHFFKIHYYISRKDFAGLSFYFCDVKNLKPKLEGCANDLKNFISSCTPYGKQVAVLESEIIQFLCTPESTGGKNGKLNLQVILEYNEAHGAGCVEGFEQTIQGFVKSSEFTGDFCKDLNGAFGKIIGKCPGQEFNTLLTKLQAEANAQQCPKFLRID